LPLAKGIRGQIGTRNSPTVLNAAFSPRQFWDGRTADLSNQSLQPLVNAIEMGNDSEGQVLQRIRDIPGYRQLFAQAYGPINRDTFAHALASFESQIVTLDDTPLHRRMAGDLTALSPAAEKGFGLASKANCFSCHSGNQFTNFAFANNGSEVATRNQGNDLGRFAINGRDDRIRAFKTPSWVELERTKPYMHNGAMPDLERVVMHYSVGGARFDGVRDPYSDPRIVAQNWTPKQRSYVVTLLRDGTKSPTYPSFDQPTLP
jgi:cytochrome c peroxidase